MKAIKPYVWVVLPVDPDTGDEGDMEPYLIQDENSLRGMTSLLQKICYSSGERKRIVRFKRDEVVEEFLKDGFILKRMVNPMTMIGVMPLLFGKARLGVGSPKNTWFDRIYDFQTIDEAVVAASQWNPEQESDPPGKWEKR